MEQTMTKGFEPPKKNRIKFFRWMEALARYDLVKSTLFGHDSTFFRVLDMNRELLEIVYREAPNVLINNPDLVLNLKYQDEFVQLLGKAVLTKNQFLCLTNADARKALPLGYPYLREWPVEIEKQLKHRELESYRAKQHAVEINNLTDYQFQNQKSINRSVAIRDHYQNGLIAKVNELSDQLDRHRLGSEQHKKLTSAMGQLQVLLQSWSVISNLIIAPDTSILEIVEL